MSLRSSVITWTQSPRSAYWKVLCILFSCMNTSRMWEVLHRGSSATGGPWSSGEDPVIKRFGPFEFEIQWHDVFIISCKHDVMHVLKIKNVLPLLMSLWQMLFLGQAHLVELKLVCFLACFVLAIIWLGCILETCVLLSSSLFSLPLVRVLREIQCSVSCLSDSLSHCCWMLV